MSQSPQPPHDGEKSASPSSKHVSWSRQNNPISSSTDNNKQNGPLVFPMHMTCGSPHDLSHDARESQSQAASPSSMPTNPFAEEFHQQQFTSTTSSSTWYSKPLNRNQPNFAAGERQASTSTSSPQVSKMGQIRTHSPASQNEPFYHAEDEHPTPSVYKVKAPTMNENERQSRPWPKKEDLSFKPPSAPRRENSPQNNNHQRMKVTPLKVVPSQSPPAEVNSPIRRKTTSAQLKEQKPPQANKAVVSADPSATSVAKKKDDDDDDVEAVQKKTEKKKEGEKVGGSKSDVQDVTNEKHTVPPSSSSSEGELEFAPHRGSIIPDSNGMVPPLSSFDVPLPPQEAEVKQEPPQPTAAVVHNLFEGVWHWSSPIPSSTFRPRIHSLEIQDPYEQDQPSVADEDNQDLEFKIQSAEKMANSHNYQSSMKMTFHNTMTGMERQATSAVCDWSASSPHMTMHTGATNTTTDPSSRINLCQLTKALPLRMKQKQTQQAADPKSPHDAVDLIVYLLDDGCLQDEYWRKVVEQNQTDGPDGRVTTNVVGKSSGNGKVSSWDHQVRYKNLMAVVEEQSRGCEKAVSVVVLALCKTRHPYYLRYGYSQSLSSIAQNISFFQTSLFSIFLTAYIDEVVDQDHPIILNDDKKKKMEKGEHPFAPWDDEEVNDGNVPGPSSNSGVVLSSEERVQYLLDSVKRTRERHGVQKVKPGQWFHIEWRKREKNEKASTTVWDGEITEILRNASTGQEFIKFFESAMRLQTGERTFPFPKEMGPVEVIDAYVSKTRGVNRANHFKVGLDMQGDTAMDDCSQAGKFSELPFSHAMALKLIRYFSSHPMERFCQHGWTKRHWIRAVQGIMLSPLYEKDTSTLRRTMTEFSPRLESLSIFKNLVGCGPGPGNNGEDANNNNAAAQQHHKKFSDFKSATPGMVGDHTLSDCILPILKYFDVINGGKVVPSSADDDENKKERDGETAEGKLPKPWQLEVEDFLEDDKDGWCPAHWIIFCLISNFENIRSSSSGESHRPILKEVVKRLSKLVETCPPRYFQQFMMMKVSATIRNVRSLIGHWAAYYEGCHLELKMALTFNSNLWAGGSWKPKPDSKFEYKGTLRIGFLERRVYPMKHLQPSHFIDTNVASSGVGENLWYSSAGSSKREQQSPSPDKALNSKITQDFQDWLEHTVFTISDILGQDWVEVRCQDDRKPKQEDYCFVQTHCISLVKRQQIMQISEEDEDTQVPLSKVLHFSLQESVDVTVSVRQSYDPDLELPTRQQFVSRQGSAITMESSNSIYESSLLLPRQASSNTSDAVSIHQQIPSAAGGARRLSNKGTMPTVHSADDASILLPRSGSGGSSPTNLAKKKFNLMLYLSRRGTEYEQAYGEMRCKASLQAAETKVPEYQAKFVPNAPIEMIIHDLPLFDMHMSDKQDASHALVKFHKLYPCRRKTLLHWFAEDIELANIFKTVIEKLKAPEIAAGCFDRSFQFPFSHFVCNFGQQFCSSPVTPIFPTALIEVIQKIGKPKARLLFEKQLLVPVHSSGQGLYAVVSEPKGVEFFAELLEQLGGGEKAGGGDSRFTLTETYLQLMLIAVCKTKNKAVLPALLQQLEKCDPDVFNEPIVPGQLPLSAAVEVGGLEVLKLLLHHSSVDATASNGIALWTAFRHHQYEAAAMLMEEKRGVDFSSFVCFSSAYPESTFHLQMRSSFSAYPIPFYPPPKEEVEFFEKYKLFDCGYSSAVLRHAKKWYKKGDPESVEILGILMDSPSIHYIDVLDCNFLEVCTEFPRWMNRIGELFATFAWISNFDDHQSRGNLITEKKWARRSQLKDLDVGGVMINIKNHGEHLKYPFHFLLEGILTQYPPKSEYWTQTVAIDANGVIGKAVEGSPSSASPLSPASADSDAHTTTRAVEVLRMLNHSFGLVEVSLATCNILLPKSKLCQIFVKHETGLVDLKIGRQAIEVLLEQIHRSAGGTESEESANPPTVSTKNQKGSDERGPVVQASEVFLDAPAKVTITPTIFTKFIHPDAMYFSFLYPSRRQLSTTHHCSKGFSALWRNGGFVYFDNNGCVVKIWALDFTQSTVDDVTVANHGDSRETFMREDALQTHQRHCRKGGGNRWWHHHQCHQSAVGSTSQKQQSHDSEDDEEDIIRTPLEFTGPIPLTLQDEQKLEGRWQDVTFPLLLKLNAKKFLWICAGESESLETKIRLPRGGFLFQFEENSDSENKEGGGGGEKPLLANGGGASQGKHHCVCFPAHLLNQTIPHYSPVHEVYENIACKLAKFMNEAEIDFKNLDVKEKSEERDELHRYLRDAFIKAPSNKDSGKKYPQLDKWGIACLSPIRLAMHLHQVELLKMMLQTGRSGLNIDLRRITPKEEDKIDEAQSFLLQKEKWEQYTDLWYNEHSGISKTASVNGGNVNTSLHKMRAGGRDRKNSLGPKSHHHMGASALPQRQSPGALLKDAIRLSFSPPMKYGYKPPSQYFIHRRVFLVEMDPSLASFQFEMNPSATQSSPTNNPLGVRKFTYNSVAIPVGSFEFCKGFEQSSLLLNIPRGSTYYAMIASMASDADELTPQQLALLSGLQNGGFVFLNIKLHVAGIFRFEMSDPGETYFSSEPKDEGEEDETEARESDHNPSRLEAYRNIIHISGPFRIPKDIGDKETSFQMECQGQQQSGKPTSTSSFVEKVSFVWARCSVMYLHGEKISYALQKKVTVPFGGFLVRRQPPSLPEPDTLDASTTGATLIAPQPYYELFVIQEKPVIWNPLRGTTERTLVPCRQEIVELLVEASTHPQVLSTDDPNTLTNIWQNTNITKYYDRFGIFWESVGVERQEVTTETASPGIHSDKEPYLRTESRVTATGLSLLLQYGYGYLLTRYELMSKAPFNRFKKDDYGVNAMLRRDQIMNRVGIFFVTDQARARGYRLQFREDSGLSVLHYAAMAKDVPLIQSLLSKHRWDIWKNEQQIVHDYLATKLRYWTPVHYAAYSGSEDCLNTFFTLGQEKGKVPWCDFTRPTIEFMKSKEDLRHEAAGSPFIHAASYPSSSPTVVTTVNYQDIGENKKCNNTGTSSCPIHPPHALFIATQFCHYKAALCLVEHGADPIERNHVTISNTGKWQEQFDKSRVSLDSYDVAICRAHAHKLFAEKREDVVTDQPYQGMLSLLERFEQEPSVHWKMFKNAIWQIFFELLVPLIIVIFGLTYIRLLYSDPEQSDNSQSIFGSYLAIKDAMLTQQQFSEINSYSALTTWVESLPSAWASLKGHAFPLGAIQVGVMYVVSAQCPFHYGSIVSGVNMSSSSSCLTVNIVPPPLAAQSNRSGSRRDYLTGSVRWVKHSDLHWAVLSSNASDPKTSRFFQNSSEETWNRNVLVGPTAQYLVFNFNFYIHALERIVSLRAGMEITPSGAFYPEHSISILRSNFHQGSAPDKGRYVIEVGWLVIFLALVSTFIVKIFSNLRIWRTRKGFHFMDILRLVGRMISRNAFHFILLMLIIVSIGFYGNFNSKAKQFSRDVKLAFADRYFYVDSYEITDALEGLRIAIAVMVAVASFGVTAGIRYIPWGVGNPANAILRTLVSGSVLVFYLLFFVFWMAVAITMYTLYSPNLFHFRTFWPSVVRSFTLMVGAEPDNFEELNKANSVASPILMLFLVLCLQLAFLNILIAVIGQEYEEQLKKSEKWWAYRLRHLIRLHNAGEHAKMSNDVLYLSDHVSGLTLRYLSEFGDLEPEHVCWKKIKMEVELRNRQ